MKPIKTVFNIVLLLLLVSQVSSAQTYISPSIADSILVPEDSITTVSCDMLECPVIGGHIFATSYSYRKGTGWESYVHVKYQPVGSPIVSWSKRVPNARNMQVVLGDHKLTPGSRYVVFYVYDEDSIGFPVVKYDRHTFTVGSGGFGSINHGGGVSWGLGYQPKVDVFPDATDTFSNGTPKMYDFVATWKTLDTFVHLTTGHVNNSTTIVHHTLPIGIGGPNIAMRGWFFDIGAQYDLDGARYVAHILYSAGSFGTNWLRHAAIDLTAATPAIISIDTLISDTLSGASGAGIKHCLDAVGLYKSSAGGASWGALILTDDHPTPSSATEVVHYNSLNNYGEVFSPPSSLWSTSTVAIAVGLGITKPGGIGSTDFIGGWRDPGTDDYYSQYVNILSGTRGSPTDYYDVCSTSTTPTLALSSSSNGGDYVLAAWWDGTDVYWKITGNSPGYKPADDGDEPDVIAGIYSGTKVVEPAAGQVYKNKKPSAIRSNVGRIYPNPATHQLYVDSYDGAAYRIIDVMGRAILSGTVTSTPVDVRELSPGCYIMQLEGNGARVSLRFSKY